MTQHLGRRPAVRLMTLICAELRDQPAARRRLLVERLPTDLSYSVTSTTVRASVAGFPLVERPVALILDRPADPEAN